MRHAAAGASLSLNVLCAAFMLPRLAASCTVWCVLAAPLKVCARVGCRRGGVVVGVPDLRKRAVSLVGTSGSGGQVALLGAFFKSSSGSDRRLDEEWRLQLPDFVVVDRNQRRRMGGGDEIVLVARMGEMVRP